MLRLIITYYLIISKQTLTDSKMGMCELVDSSSRTAANVLNGLVGPVFGPFARASKPDIFSTHSLEANINQLVNLYTFMVVMGKREKKREKICCATFSFPELSTLCSSAPLSCFAPLSRGANKRPV